MSAYAAELSTEMGTNAYAARLRIQGGTIAAYDGAVSAAAIKVLADGTVEMPMGIYTEVIHAHEVRVTNITQFSGESIVLSGVMPSFYGDSSSLANEIATVGNVAGEEERAKGSELSLTLAVSTEASRAKSGELSLTLAVSTEASRASSSELSLDGRLGVEEIRAAASELSLTLAVSTEASRAKSSELSLTLGVSTETNRASTAETSIDTRLDEAFSGVAGHITALDISGWVKVSGDVSALSFTTTSDARLKKDVETVMNALEIVSKIHPVYYNWVDNRATVNPGHKEIGFLAQELEAVLPNVVKTYTDEVGLDGGRKAVSYDRMVSLLVAAIKELKADVDALKAQVAAMKA